MKKRNLGGKAKICSRTNFDQNNFPRLCWNASINDREPPMKCINFWTQPNGIFREIKQFYFYPILNFVYLCIWTAWKSIQSCVVETVPVFNIHTNLSRLHIFLMKLFLFFFKLYKTVVFSFYNFKCKPPTQERRTRCECNSITVKYCQLEPLY